MTDSIQVLKPGVRMTDATGAVLSGAVLYFYDAGTSNARTVYSNYGLSTSLGVSVTCDSGGYPSSDGSTKVEVYTGTGAYRAKLVDSQANTVWDQDNIVGALDTSPFTAASFAKPDTDCASDTADTTLTTAELGTVRNGNPTGGSFTYTLPSAITVTNGKGYKFKHVGTANQLNIAGVLGQTIDGLTTYSVKGQYEEIEITSDGANWHVTGDANRSNQAGALKPQGYLTLVSGTPQITSDQAAATSVYYTPDAGNLVPIYDGTRWVMKEFDELTLTLAAQHLANTIYDVFVWLESGVVTIGTGPAWATSTAGAGARGTGAGTTQLTRTKGLHLNTVSMTTRNGASTYTVAASRATWLGSILIDGTNGQVTCHVSWGSARRWAVWNAHNQRPIQIFARDSTSSYVYTLGTVRPANGDTNNHVRVFSGLADKRVKLTYQQTRTAGGGSAISSFSMIGIGVDTTATMTGSNGHGGAGPSSGGAYSTRVTDTAYYTLAGLLGVSVITALESNSISGAGSVTHSATEASMRLTADWQG
jgi:hypothetical protein